MNIIDTIEQNLDELTEAHRSIPESFLRTREKQQNAVARSLERCGRCGDHIAFLTPVHMSTFCSACTAHLKALDVADNGQPFMYFREMVHAIMSKKPT